ncbi:hypothetical protein [Cohnella sp. GCM10012308]|uniref:hypothetical protein n=1 Tax=Cohnella sp. GCM10012308 TaxID=3317329 RepID=UPI00360BCF5D
MEKEREELPDIPIRLWFYEPPARSDFTRKSRKAVRRLHGADMEKILLLPPPVPFDGRRRRPLRSTIFLMFFVRSAGWLKRFFRSR